MKVEDLLIEIGKDLRKDLGDGVTVVAKVYKKVTVPQIVAFGEVMIVSPNPLDAEEYVREMFVRYHRTYPVFLFTVTYSYGSNTDEYYAYIPNCDRMYIYFVEFELSQIWT